MHPFEKLELQVAEDRYRDGARRRRRREQVGTVLATIAGCCLAASGVTSLAERLARSASPPAPSSARFEFIDAGTRTFSGDLVVRAPDSLVFRSPYSHQLGGELRGGGVATVIAGSQCACMVVPEKDRTPGTCATSMSGTTLHIVTDQPEAVVRYFCWR